MIAREPIPHWNNFTVPELKRILEHCRALERLGIAQDEEMIVSIERDITIREKKPSAHYARSARKQQKENQIKINKRQQPQEHLLEQNVQ